MSDVDPFAPAWEYNPDDAFSGARPLAGVIPPPQEQEKLERQAFDSLKLPLDGMSCFADVGEGEICGAKVYQTSAGTTCDAGHGGAPYDKLDLPLPHKDDMPPPAPQGAPEAPLGARGTDDPTSTPGAPSDGALAPPGAPSGPGENPTTPPDPFSPPKRLSVLQDEPLSVSRIRKAVSCLHAFKLSYIDKVDKNTSIMTEFAEELEESSRSGVLVHGALERVYKYVLANEIRGEVSEEIATKAFRRAFIESEVRDEKGYQEGLELVRDYVSRTKFDHDMLIPDELGGGIERKFNLQAGEFWILGYIDLIEYHGDGIFEVVDFKTNKNLFTKDELAKDVQLSVYGWAIRELFEDVKEVHFRFEMLRHGVSQRAHRTLEQCIDGVRYLTDMARQLEVRSTFPPTLGMLCSWCNVRHHCEAYKAAQRPENADKLMGLVANEKMGLEDICDHRERAYAVEKLAGKRRRDIDKIILNRLDYMDEGFFVSGDNVRYKPIQRSEKHWTLDKIEAAFKRVGVPAEQLDFEKFVRVQKGNLEEYVKSLKLEKSRHAMLMALLDAMAHIEKKQVYLDGRRLKR